jgi:hypothetical protein
LKGKYKMPQYSAPLSTPRVKITDDAAPAAPKPAEPKVEVKEETIKEDSSKKDNSSKK